MPFTIVLFSCPLGLWVSLWNFKTIRGSLLVLWCIILSSIKFRKGFAKFMIWIALFKKFLS